MAQKLPKMAQNYPKWPKNDARIYALFPQIFFTEKAVPQTFSLLECMHGPKNINAVFSSSIVYFTLGYSAASTHYRTMYN